MLTVIEGRRYPSLGWHLQTVVEPVMRNLRSRKLENKVVFKREKQRWKAENKIYGVKIENTNVGTVEARPFHPSADNGPLPIAAADSHRLAAGWRRSWCGTGSRWRRAPWRGSSSASSPPTTGPLSFCGFGWPGGGGLLWRVCWIVLARGYRRITGFPRAFGGFQFVFASSKTSSSKLGVFQ